MPRSDGEVVAIARDAEFNRRALAATIGEIGQRLRPQHLATTAQRRISGKVRESLGELGDAIRSERGKAAVLAAGAVAAFYVGRSTQPQPHSPPDLNTPEQPLAAFPKERQSGFHLLSAKTDRLAQIARKLATAAGAIATGYAIGTAAPTSQPERDLMGEASIRVKDFATEFRRTHATGARFTVVQSLGVAQIAAAALGVMGALAALVGDRRKSGQPSNAYHQF